MVGMIGAVALGVLVGAGALWLFQFFRSRHRRGVLLGSDKRAYQVIVADRMAVNTDDLPLAKAERKRLRHGGHPAYLMAHGKNRG